MTPQAQLDKDIRGGSVARLEHRHYAAIAGIIANIPPGENSRDDIAAWFARSLQANPRFDRVRFLRACHGA